MNYLIKLVGIWSLLLLLNGCLGPKEGTIEYDIKKVRDGINTTKIENDHTVFECKSTFAKPMNELVELKKRPHEKFGTARAMVYRLFYKSNTIQQSGVDYVLKGQTSEQLTELLAALNDNITINDNILELMGKHNECVMSSSEDESEKVSYLKRVGARFGSEKIHSLMYDSIALNNLELFISYMDLEVKTNVKKSGKRLIGMFAKLQNLPQYMDLSAKERKFFYSRNSDAKASL